jgi:hypothetical protein
MHKILKINAPPLQLLPQLLSTHIQHIHLNWLLACRQFPQQNLLHHHLLLLLKYLQPLLVQFVEIVFRIDLLGWLLKKVPLEGLLKIRIWRVFIIWLGPHIREVPTHHQLLRIHSLYFLFDPLKDHFFHGCLQLQHSLLVFYTLQLSLPFDLLLPLKILLLEGLVLLLFFSLVFELNGKDGTIFFLSKSWPNYCSSFLFYETSVLSISTILYCRRFFWSRIALSFYRGSMIIII